MAEKYWDKTPFAYVSNNPINLIDPDGMSQSDVEMLRRRGCMDAQDDATMNAYDAVMRDKANEDAARDAQFWGSAGLNGDQAARLSGGNARVGAMVDGMHAAATSAGQYDAFSAEYGTAWAGTPNYEAFKGFYKRNRAGSDGGGDDDGYGSTFSERVTNPELWKKIGHDFLFGRDDTNVTSATLADHPLSWLIGGGGAKAIEFVNITSKSSKYYNFLIKGMSADSFMANLSKAFKVNWVSNGAVKMLVTGDRKYVYRAASKSGYKHNVDIYKKVNDSWQQVSKYRFK